MKKIIFSLFFALPLIASAQTTLTPQEQLEQAQKQLEQAQKALEVAKANAARAAAEAEAKAKAEAEAKAKAEAEAKAKADAEASAKAAEIQKQIEELKRQTAALEEQAAKLDGVSKGSPMDDSQKSGKSQPAAMTSSDVQNSPKSEIKTRLTPVGDDDNSNDNDDKYLAAGAVPIVDGKVEWTTTINVPGKDADALFSVSKEYLSRLVSDKLQLPGSQVAIINASSHSLAATVHEWLVFRNSALSLDRAEIFYLLKVNCADGKVVATMSRIKYKYSVQGKTETYLAEKWITDKEAVNKKRTRLYPISGKFRRKTIDRKDEIFETLSEALK